MPSATTRKFDLVLYGATGFVGRRAAAYLTQPRGRRKPRWAIAGRDAGKLQALRDELARDPAAKALPEVIVADSGDAAAVEAMAASTRVLVTTAGPYALYGDAIVDACVHQRTHYADITGETAWVRRVIDRHHARAARDGTRIVPFCGFDSVPSDLGTLLLVRHIEATFGAPCVEVNAYFQMMGGFSGGTLATNAHRYESGEVKAGNHPFLLDPGTRHSAAELRANHDPHGAHFDAAIGVPDEKSGEAVKIVVVKKDESLTDRELLDHCRQHLTNYKLPRMVEFRTEPLPKTPIGKILRRELRAPAVSKGKEAMPA